MNDVDLTIIIVDDDEGTRKLIVKNLRRSGLSNAIKEFNDGQEALDFLFDNRGNPHISANIRYLLLLDIRMPRVNGVEVLDRIKREPRFANMPVIMLTTTDNPQEVSRCYELGCNCYISKPVVYEEFVQCIRQLGLFIKVLSVVPLSNDWRSMLAPAN